MARPSKYTPQAVERICQAVRLGATYVLASQIAGGKRVGGRYRQGDREG